MLFPQVPHDVKQKVATEWKMDLKLLSASRKVETEGEDNRIARLEAVVDFIQQYGNVGSVDEPDEYIADTLSMRWGLFHLPPPKAPVFFAGETEKTVVGLGGSPKHLLGRPGEGEPYDNSLTPALLDCLFKELGWGEDHFKGRGGTPARTHEIFLRAVEATVRDMKGPSQRLEFLAKRLLHGPVMKWRYEPLADGRVQLAADALLGTPLYVAMAD